MTNQKRHIDRGDRTAGILSGTTQSGTGAGTRHQGGHKAPPLHAPPNGRSIHHQGETQPWERNANRTMRKSSDTCTGIPCGCPIIGAGTWHQGGASITRAGTRHRPYTHPKRTEHTSPRTNTTVGTKRQSDNAKILGPVYGHPLWVPNHRGGHMAPGRCVHHQGGHKAPPLLVHKNYLYYFCNRKNPRFICERIKTVCLL